ncbi:ABC transporter permease [Oscillochloris sp. ZM17-4]|uniref:ABC transporter permease n=1 Tax=Oscillochloris sp. ZM17-4 TaxID=2866714 RepID=UPI001C73B953|nr:ABC transporter permease [Oscillochloris sp. ZM17-4]MBX0329445.1 ABC transporter permease [Oscillochloris sp. ZM17-4]
MSEANQAMDTPAKANLTTQAQQLTTGVAVKPRTLVGDAWRRFRKHRLAMAGVIILVFFTLAVSLGSVPYQSYLVGQLATSGMPVPQENPDLRVLIDHLDFLNLLVAPNSVHLLGTDDLGRDLLARSLYGGRVSLLVGLVAMLISIVLGTVIGAVAGFFGGTIDQVLMRITDLFLSLPAVPLILLTVYLFRDPVIKAMGSPEAGIFIIVVVVVGGLAWMQTARIVRATFLSLKEKEFVEAATCLGVGKVAIMFKHILPNALGPIIVAATLGVGNAIITESTLSFLGVGFPPDTPTWGRLVTDGSQYLSVAPWLALVPGALIFLTVLSINFLGDGLRDALDPRSRL